MACPYINSIALRAVGRAPTSPYRRIRDTRRAATSTTPTSPRTPHGVNVIDLLTHVPVSPAPVHSLIVASKSLPVGS